MPTNIENLLRSAAQTLSQSPTPRLDVEILLMHALKISRETLYAKLNEIISQKDLETFRPLLNRRALGEPIAYITGHREFWNLDLIVTPDVLIPRPETELLVEKVLTLFSSEETIDVLDLGTGSGAIALAIASERPNWKITATDKYREALKIAKQNAEQYQLKNINFLQSHWFDQLPQKLFHVMVSNPPYVDSENSYLQQNDVRFEPRNALVSLENGLSDIKCIVQHAKKFLKAHGYLMLEHGYLQGDEVQALFVQNKYQNIRTLMDLSGHPRVTLGQKI